MKNQILALTLTVIALLSGCATAHKMKSLSLGMSKAEVIDKLGKPVSRSTIGGVEALRYEFYDSSDDAFLSSPTEYRVFLKKGRVTQSDQPGGAVNSSDSEIY
jgi:hypothetical protein